MAYVNVNSANDDSTLVDLNTAVSRGTTFETSAVGFTESAPGAFGDNPTVQGFSGGAIVKEIWVVMSNTSGGGRNITLELYDGKFTDSTDISAYTLLGSESGKAVPATNTNEVIMFTNISPTVVLYSGMGYTLRVIQETGSTGDIRIMRGASTSYLPGDKFYTIGTSITLVPTESVPFRLIMEDPSENVGTFTNVNQSTGTSGGAFNAGQHPMQTFRVEGGFDVVDALQGEFNSVPTMGAIFGTSWLKSINIVTSSISTSTIYVEVYQGTPPATYAESGDPYVVSNQLLVIADGTQELVFTESNVKPFYSGNDYYFIIFTDNANSGSINYEGSNRYSNGSRYTYFTGTGNLSIETNTELVFRTNFTESLDSSNDPVIHTFLGNNYYLPVNDWNYCLYDNMDSDERLVINCKTHIRKNGRSYIRFVYMYYDGEEMLIRLPNLIICDIPNDVEKLACIDNVPKKKVQFHQSDRLCQIKKNGKVRKFVLKTRKYGQFHILFKRSKFGFSIQGNVSRLLTDSCVGCYKGEKHMMRIAKINYKSVL